VPDLLEALDRLGHALEFWFRASMSERRGRSSTLKTRSIAVWITRSKSGVAKAIQSERRCPSSSRAWMKRRTLRCSSSIPSLASPTPRRKAP
jgi:hypothetical protein